ncbi:MULTISPECIES: autotransporter domain-containing protein [unclassified Beijerinckia]|uniref:autotransporter outer membrane beta-barrel domain-containing protein n=1 Tax=unclassified Beijerinckia TaxID=2638183 RepID=UPI00089870B6|nr:MULTISPECIES: autotransporter domain-containing protein [unclassified Beijerinckia]MDH7795531.1 uncharacterized protein with beta-barrel porin domain [Beijerinckia sp. GAS462]SEC05435.1 Uncharacterized conserved protein, contains a C-terminal beta-barrel porin domain [Beijerinckia sp. 28-YEA-48]
MFGSGKSTLGGAPAQHRYWLNGVSLAALVVAASLSAAVTASAQQGGAGGSTFQRVGGLAGALGQSGGNGRYEDIYTGGGGAGGGGGGSSLTNTTGTFGGTGGNGFIGAAGGGTGQNGQDASGFLSGAGGGGGGSGGRASLVLSSTTGLGGSFSGSGGGDGGNGGSATDRAYSGGGGGGGGAGGIGAIFTGTGISINVYSTSNVGGGAGGNGGNGGNANPASDSPSLSYGGNGGSGGDGGSGVLLTSPGITLTNNGTIIGGNGGVGGTGGSTLASPATTGLNGQAGAGGAGVVGGDLIVINNGSITGGMGGDGLTQANAITFTGGANQLTVGTAGTISGNIALNGGGSLALDQSANNATISNIITGDGALIKDGSATVTLTGVNTYTGKTTVDAGILSVNGSIASSSLVTVNGGGTLAGTGIVGNTLINAGGTLAPGNSIGTLAVQGDLTFMAGSAYQVEVSPSNADRVNVSGIATLNGATLSAFYGPGAYVTKRYTVLNAAGGVNGTFSGPVNTNLPTNFSTALNYDQNNAYLDLSLNYTPPDPGPGPTPPNFGGGLTVNQLSVANALVNSFNTAGGIPLVFGALGPSGLSQASGEAGTGVQQATLSIMDRFLNLMSDPYASGRTTTMMPMSYAPLPRGTAPLMVTQQSRWSVWGASYGGTQTTRGQALTGTSTAINGIFGVVAGADYRATPDTVIGFALGGGGTSYRLASGAGSGSANMFQAGLYGRQTFGSAYVAGSLAYGWQDVTTDRRVMFDQLRARFNASAFSGRLEGGYRFGTPFGGVTPYAAGQFTNISLPNYSEQAITGPGLFALNYGSKSVTAWRSELGLRSDTAFEMGDATLTLRGRLAWAHNYNPNSSISASFLNLPASGFTVTGAALARNAALVSAGAEMKWQGGLSIAATFEGEFSGRGNSYAGKGAIRYQW